MGHDAAVEVENDDIGMPVVLDSDIEAEVHALIVSRRGDGSWSGWCRPRLLETALALALLREIGVDPVVCARLEAYCRTELAESRSRVGRHRIDEAYSILLANIVIRRSAPSSAELLAMRAALNADPFTSSRRKLVMLDALLGMAHPGVSLGIIGFRSGDGEPNGSLHRWIVLLLRAIRLWRGDSPAYDADVEELVRTQNADGIWEKHILASLIILFALWKTGVASQTVGRGVDFLCAMIRDRGGVAFIPDEDIWVTVLAALTCSEAGVDLDSLKESERYILARQMPDGGWGCARGLTQADADDTSVAVTFLSRQDSDESIAAARRGMTWLLDVQNGDGGFPAFVRGAPSEVEITAKCVRALASCSDRIRKPEQTAAAVQAGWNWLVAQQRPDGGFPNDWSLSSTFPVMHVARVAQMVGHASGSTMERCVAYLASLACPDGGWPLVPGDAVSHPLSTAYAVTALAAQSLSTRAGSYTGLFERGVARLVDATPQSPCAPDGIGPRPFVFDVPMLHPIYRLAALNAVRAARA